MDPIQVGIILTVFLFGVVVIIISTLRDGGD
jgi:hypothetical protein